MIRQNYRRYLYNPLIVSNTIYNAHKISATPCGIRDCFAHAHRVYNRFRDNSRDQFLDNDYLYIYSFTRLDYFAREF